MILNICINYGARRNSARIKKLNADQDVDVSLLTPETFSIRYERVAPVDLLIRTVAKYVYQTLCFGS